MIILEQISRLAELCPPLCAIVVYFLSTLLFFVHAGRLKRSVSTMFDLVICVNISVGVALLLVAAAFFIVCDSVMHKRIVHGGAAGRYVLITGCDSGFGKRAAQRLDTAGCHVIATFLTPEGATAMREMCSSCLTAVQMDVTDDASTQQAFSVVTELLQPDKGDCSCSCYYCNFCLFLLLRML